ncbi:hypothetical protein FS763_04450 [Agrobacterium vitis]|uniref:hypothetical protein n=1 Tax=Allorhizobium ampelinum TaxID=3025782 RepID=UPI001F2B667E|nr:hypothetical protein [Allorhizobium ampelinum]MCF1471177.1 hypothetical protein [Allorhizobium ampelinum]
MGIEFHQQLFRHDPENGVYGDCFRTVIACLLKKKPEDVPHFCNGPDDGKTDVRVEAYLRPQGYVLLCTLYDGDLDLDHLMQIGKQNSRGLHWLLTGRSRSGCNHVVICKDDQIIHDTSLNKSGIIGPASSGFYYIEWLVRLAPCDEASS